MVIIMATDPAISAKPLLRSSVIGFTLVAMEEAVNARER